MKTAIRAVAALGVAAAALSVAHAQDADRLSFDDPGDVIAMNRKIACSTVDGEPITFYWHGYAFSRRQGEADRRLFRVEGMNVRACVEVEHPDYGTGYRLVSRELLLYLDPETNEILSTWDNPWTGETVDVIQVANDPVNSRAPSFPNGPRGPAEFRGSIQGDDFWQTTTVPLFYPNPLGGDYEAEIGGTYHATEMFNFFGSVENLTDPETTTADVEVGWVRMSDWLPWMKMQGREGVIYFHTAGTKLESWDALPEFFKEEIAENYPEYDQPPPLDDARENVTSWIYYRDVMTGEVEAPERN